MIRSSLESKIYILEGPRPAYQVANRRGLGARHLDQAPALDRPDCHDPAGPPRVPFSRYPFSVEAFSGHFLSGQLDLDGGLHPPDVADLRGACIALGGDAETAWDARQPPPAHL